MRESERPTDPRGKRRQRLAIGGAAVAAVLAGGLFALLVSGRDEVQPLTADASPSPTVQIEESATPSPSQTPTPPETPARAPEPTETPLSPATDTWIGPERIATRDYGELSLVVDEDGIAHAAAELDDAIYYLTNASGSWTREPLSTPPDGGHDGAPAIAIDRDGSLAVVFMRYRTWYCELGCYSDDPDGLYVVSNASGSWSAPDHVPVEVHSTLTSEAVSVRDGALYVAYELYAGDGRDRASVWYATNRSGAWTTHHVADDSTPLGGPAAIQVPLEPRLALAADGTPRIAFGFNDRLHYAVATGAGGFAVESVPEAAWDGGNGPSALLLRLDSLDRPHIVYADSDGASRYIHRADGAWSAPELTFPDTPADRCGWWQVSAFDMAMSDRGALHVVSRNTTIFSGLWFATNRSGEFETRQLWPPEHPEDFCDGAIDSDPTRPAATATDGAGRPHVLFVTGWGATAELWYVIGPGD